MKLSQNKCCKSDIPTAMVKADIMAKKVTASINKAMIKKPLPPRASVVSGG